MTVIELSDRQAAVLQSKAAAQGLSLEGWIAQLAGEAESGIAGGPFKTGRGLLLSYGPAPSDDEISDNRRDMFRGFAQER